MIFYALLSPKLSETREITDFIQADPVNLGEAPKCPVCDQYLGMLSWLPPHRAVLEIYDVVFGDIAFGTGNSLLISERFKEIIKSKGITGFNRFDPVEIVKVKKHSIIKEKPPNILPCNCLQNKDQN